MKFKHLANIALIVFLFSLCATTQAQTTKTNQPFSWNKSSDSWYMSKNYSFQYATGEFTAKGNKVSHGPVCTNACRETTAPGACTESMVTDACTDVELPADVRIPAGYNGVEYVSFEVQKNGRVYGYQVVKQPVVCPPCIQTAVNIVAGLGEWFPANQEGIPVKSSVVVPVYFKM